MNFNSSLVAFVKSNFISIGEFVDFFVRSEKLDLSVFG
jgi:hypothetical protein